MKTMLASLAFSLLAGCAGFMGPGGLAPRAPQGVLEQIEATDISLQQVSASIVRLTCTQYVARKCIETGKAFDAESGTGYHTQVQDGRAALATALTLRAGEVGDCLGAKRTREACLSVVKLVLLQMERKVLEAKGGKP